jgi:hypothetical protein
LLGREKGTANSGARRVFRILLHDACATAPARVFGTLLGDSVGRSHSDP